MFNRLNPSELQSAIVRHPLIVKPDTTVMNAIAQLMAEHRVSSIMIVQPGGSQTEPLQIPVVQQIMEQRLIRRLAVTGKQGELLGIVTKANLLQALNPLELYKLAEVLEKKSVLLEAEKIELLETRNVELEQQIEARMMLLAAKAERERLVLNSKNERRNSRQYRSAWSCPSTLRRSAVGSGIFKKTPSSGMNGCTRALYGVTKTSDSYVNYEIWENWLHPNDRNPTKILLQQALLGKAEYDTEFRVVHPDDSIHFIKAYGMVVRDAQGNPQKMIGVNFDISDRKRAELALQSSEMRFRRIFDSNVVGMLFADLQGRILDANDRFLEMVGYTRDDLDAGTIDSLRMTPPEHIPVDLVVREHLMQHGEINPWEKEYYRKDGSRIPVLIGAAILPGSDNQTICIVVDISEQQAALGERKQAEEIIRQQVEREQLLREITQRIRQSLDLQTIFDTACQEIRQFRRQKYEGRRQKGTHV